MTTEETTEEPKKLCPMDNRELLASALDGHLFCPECGHQPPPVVKVDNDNGE